MSTLKTDKFSEWGIASVLPGAQYILDRMQEEINYLKQVLQAHQESRQEGLRRVAQQVNREFGFDSKRGEFVEPKRRGRPPGAKSKRGQWRTPEGRLMTKAERLVEGKRRRSLWSNPEADTKSPNHPRNADHPGHAAWLAALRKAQKKRWDSMSAAQQKKHLNKMAASKAARVNGQATEASA